jgi:hypothetical protein
VPPGAVALIPVQVEPQSVVGNAVLSRQRIDDHVDERLGDVGDLGVLGGEPWFVEQLVIHPSLMLGERHRIDQPRHQAVIAAEPSGHHVDPRRRVQVVTYSRAERLVDGNLATNLGEQALLLGPGHAVRWMDARARQGLHPADCAVSVGQASE